MVDRSNRPTLHDFTSSLIAEFVNFGPVPVPLPGGTVVLTSAPVAASQLPADTTAWLVSA